MREFEVMLLVAVLFTGLLLLISGCSSVADRLDSRPEMCKALGKANVIAYDAARI